MADTMTPQTISDVMTEPTQQTSLSNPINFFKLQQQ